MANKIKKAALLTAAVMTFSAFQGCALVQFEDPDNLKIEEDQLSSRQEAASNVSAFSPVES